MMWKLLLVWVLALAGLMPEAALAQGRMVKTNAIIHVVASLEPSIAFYRDAVGFELVAPPAPLRASGLLDLAKASAPNATARTAAFRIPGSEMEFRLIEFSGANGTRFEQRLYDPGVTRFSIQVRDIDAAFNRVKDKVLAVDTTGGAPVYTQRPRNDTRAVMMRDPDGFVFEFVQGDPLPQTDVPASSNIYNARSSLAVEDTEKALAFYRDVLGFTNRPTNPGVAPAVLALEGTPNAVAKTTSTSPPGGTNVWFLWEFSNIERTKREPRVFDPGASALSIQVENRAALVERMRAAGVKVESNSVVRSPDGLLIELVEN
jgi:catechol 2,3-dioxygenase-like lactoylglutathione lyase family enzyme